MEKWLIVTIALFLNVIMVPLSSAVAIADANADPNADPLNIYVNVQQNIGDGDGGIGSLNNVGPEEVAPEEVVPEEIVTTTEAPTTATPGCPDGLFMFGPSDKCYKFVNDTDRAYPDADKYCRDHGWRLAHPEDPLAMRILLSEMDQQNLVRKIWLGAKANGTTYIWQQDGQVLSNDDSLWNDHNSNEVGYCLTLDIDSRDIESNPNQAYIDTECEDDERGALCELA